MNGNDPVNGDDQGFFGRNVNRLSEFLGGLADDPDEVADQIELNLPEIRIFVDSEGNPQILDADRESHANLKSLEEYAAVYGDLGDNDEFVPKAGSGARSVERKGVGRKPPDLVEHDFATEIINNVLMGHGPEVFGAMDYLIAKLPGGREPRSLSESIEDQRQHIRTWREENPWQSLGAVAGTAAPWNWGVKGLKAASQVVPYASRVGDVLMESPSFIRNIVGGGLFGAALGAGEAGPGARREGAERGAMIGGPLQAALPYALKPVAGVAGTVAAGLQGALNPHGAARSRIRAAAELGDPGQHIDQFATDTSRRLRSMDRYDPNAGPPGAAAPSEQRVSQYLALVDEWERSKGAHKPIYKNGRLVKGTGGRKEGEPRPSPPGGAWITDATIADASRGGGPRALLADATREAGPARDMATRRFAARAAREEGRVLSTIEETFQNSALGRSALVGQARESARPLYQEAYDHVGNQAIMTPEIAAILATPAGRRAFRAAARGMANIPELRVPEKVVDDYLERFDRFIGEGINIHPTTGKVTLRPLTQMIYFPLQLLDETKKNLWIMGSARVARGGLETSSYQRTSAELGKLLDAVDATRPPVREGFSRPQGAYARARKIHQSNEALDAAYDMGSNFETLTPEKITELLKGMAAGEQNMFRAAAAAALRERVRNLKTTGSIAERIWGTSASKARMGALIPNAQQRRLFEAMIVREGKLARGARESLGGGAGRLLADEVPSVLTAAAVVGGTKAGGAVGGHAMMMAGEARRRLIRFLSVAKRSDQEVADLLSSRSPKVQMELLDELRSLNRIPSNDRLARILTKGLIASALTQQQYDHALQEGREVLTPGGSRMVPGALRQLRPVEILGKLEEDPFPAGR